MKIPRRSVLTGGAMMLTALAGCGEQDSRDPESSPNAESSDSSVTDTSNEPIIKQARGDFGVPEILLVSEEPEGYDDFTVQPDATYESTEGVWYYFEVDGIHYKKTDTNIITELSLYRTLRGPEGDVRGEREKKFPLKSEFSTDANMNEYYIYDKIEPHSQWDGGTYTITIKSVDDHTGQVTTEEGKFKIPEVQSDYLSELATDPVFRDDSATISRTYEGEPGYIFNTEFTFNFSQSMYDYYRKKPRPYPDNFQRRYGSYVSTALDNRLIADITNWFREYGQEERHSEMDILNHIISFVHRLKYTDDYVGTGYNEYPKYPIETLVERGGDCEDTAILLASLLESLGYETRLLLATSEMMDGADQGHAAVGVYDNKGRFSGSYWEDNGKQFYYIESTESGTTNKETASGKIGVENRMNRAYVRPVNQEPLLAVNGQVTGTDGSDITVSGYILNTSTIDADGIRVEAYLMNEADSIVAGGSETGISVPRWDWEDSSNSQAQYEISTNLDEASALKLVVNGYIDDDIVARSSSDTVYP